MRRLLPRSLAGQLVVLLLAGLLIAQAAAFVIFFDERRQALREAHNLGILERMASIRRVLERTPSAERDDILAAVGSPGLRIWISADSAIERGDDGYHARWLAAQLTALLPADLTEPARVHVEDSGPLVWRHHHRHDWGRVRRPFPGDDDGGDDEDDHGDGRDDDDGDDDTRDQGTPRGPVALAVSLPLSDGQWLNAVTTLRGARTGWAWPYLLSMLLTVAAILAAVALTMRRITRPLTALSHAAERLGRGEAVDPLAETGPEEVRRTTAAFNAMQTRLTRFLRDRTTMLAAISHDLRTPITALRLRAELVEDEETRAKLLDILEEMQRMTEATLTFAREEARQEETRLVDLAALTASLCDDLAEMGLTVSFAEAGKTPVACRPVGLRRALRNLIENAVAYGQRARVSLNVGEDEVGVVIEDDGPGIPAGEHERVFSPFVRLEESRSRETGGIGLGMAIARSIVRGHGGDITLENRPEGGLRAIVHLPRKDAENITGSTP